jgi:hypothetical protein
MIDLFNELINWMLSYVKGYDLADGLIIMRKGSYLLRKGRDSSKTARYSETLAAKLKNYQFVEKAGAADPHCREVMDTLRRVMRFYWE